MAHERGLNQSRAANKRRRKNSRKKAEKRKESYDTTKRKNPWALGSRLGLSSSKLSTSGKRKREVLKKSKKRLKVEGDNTQYESGRKRIHENFNFGKYKRKH